MEAKLLQQLAFREQVPIYGFFLDSRKTFDAMDRGRCLTILEDTGVGPCTLRLIKSFWDNKVLVCPAAKYYGRPFKSERGVTQGGPLLPTIFNLIVDAIARK